MAPVLDQISKQAEDLRFHCHRTLRAPKFEKLGVQSEAAESINHGGPQASSRTNPALLNEDSSRSTCKPCPIMRTLTSSCKPSSWERREPRTNRLHSKEETNAQRVRAP